MKVSVEIVLVTLISSLISAAPAPTPAPFEISFGFDFGKGAQHGSTTILTAVQPTPTKDLIGGLLDNINSAINPAATGNILQNVLNDLKLVQATAVPIAVSAASSSLSAILATQTPTNLKEAFNGIAQIVEAGLTTDNVVDLVDFLDGFLVGENSFNNFNPRNPKQRIFPQANPKDAPFSMTEGQLRAVIHIPLSFKYGKGAQPIILVPGTGSTGYLTFIGNYIPLLQNSKIADPVWLNIPGFMLNDAQSNAEYIAYAINYIAGITGRQVAVLSWSQGGLDSQWAYKYWPSIRSKVTDHIAISPDYHGTILANFIATPDIPLPPAILQQRYDSKYVTTLRADDGDSAYVPTTTIYSAFFDEIVELQNGPNASAILLDAHHLGTSNNEVQTVCRNQAAGTFYTHEGVLYNPLGFALLKDALSHPGPGQVSRLDLGKVCSTYLTEGLDLTEFLLSENAILGAVVTVLTYQPGTLVEPPIRPYAQTHKPYSYGSPPSPYRYP